jgi:solute carrier family 13 (sodium-dependent dicarboxylate transporter), member 2/3/5
LIPLVINVVKFLALDPLPYIYISTVAANCAYLLPTSVRAIPVGYGFNPQTMFLRGIWLL